MKWGIQKLFCPVCSAEIRLNAPLVFTPHHRQFGYCCSKECFTAAELKYSRLILGKDDETLTEEKA